MADYSQYPDSVREIKTEQFDNFKPIGALAAALVAAAAKRAGGAK